jgi:hypothetical protein
MATQRPTLPTDRAFVVQVHADAAVGQGQVWGRVEHIVSGRTTHFQSVEDLVTFMVQVLTRAPEDSEPSTDSNEAEGPT